MHIWGDESDRRTPPSRTYRNTSERLAIGAKGKLRRQEPQETPHRASRKLAMSFGEPHVLTAFTNAFVALRSLRK
jgi:hypothetical protein